MLIKNSFTISPPVKKNVFLNNLVHSSFVNDLFILIQFAKLPCSFCISSIFCAFLIAAFIFNRLRMMPTSASNLDMSLFL